MSIVFYTDNEGIRRMKYRMDEDSEVHDVAFDLKLERNIGAPSLYLLPFDCIENYYEMKQLVMEVIRDVKQYQKEYTTDYRVKLHPVDQTYYHEILHNEYTQKNIQELVLVLTLRVFNNSVIMDCARYNPEIFVELYHIVSEIGENLTREVVLQNVIGNQINAIFLKELLKEGSDLGKIVNLPQEEKALGIHRIFYSACREGDIETAQDILDHHATEIKSKILVNNQQRTVLHNAVYDGDYEVVKLLLEYKYCDINAKDNMGSTAFDIAFSELIPCSVNHSDPNYYKIVKLLSSSSNMQQSYSRSVTDAINWRASAALKLLHECGIIISPCDIVNGFARRDTNITAESAQAGVEHDSLDTDTNTIQQDFYPTTNVYTIEKDIEFRTCLYHIVNKMDSEYHSPLVNMLAGAQMYDLLQDLITNPEYNVRISSEIITIIDNIIESPARQELMNFIMNRDLSKFDDSGIKKLFFVAAEQKDYDKMNEILTDFDVDLYDVLQLVLLRNDLEMFEYLWDVSLGNINLDTVFREMSGSPAAEPLFMFVLNNCIKELNVTDATYQHDKKAYHKLLGKAFMHNFTEAVKWLLDHDAPITSENSRLAKNVFHNASIDNLTTVQCMFLENRNNSLEDMDAMLEGIRPRVPCTKLIKSLNLSPQLINMILQVYGADVFDSESDLGATIFDKHPTIEMLKILAANNCDISKNNQAFADLLPVCYQVFMLQNAELIKAYIELGGKAQSINQLYRFNRKNEEDYYQELSGLIKFLDENKMLLDFKPIFFKNIYADTDTYVGVYLLLTHLSSNPQDIPEAQEVFGNLWHAGKSRSVLEVVLGSRCPNAQIAEKILMQANADKDFFATRSELVNLLFCHCSTADMLQLLHKYSADINNDFDSTSYWKALTPACRVRDKGLFDEYMALGGSVKRLSKAICVLKSTSSKLIEDIKQLCDNYGLVIDFDEMTWVSPKNSELVRFIYDRIDNFKMKPECHEVLLTKILATKDQNGQEMFLDLITHKEYGVHISYKMLKEFLAIEHTIFCFSDAGVSMGKDADITALDDFYAGETLNILNLFDLCNCDNDVVMMAICYFAMHNQIDKMKEVIIATGIDPAKYINTSKHEDAISLVLDKCNLEALQVLLNMSHAIDHNYIVERTLISAASPELKGEILDFVLDHGARHEGLSDHIVMMTVCYFAMHNQIDKMTDVIASTSVDPAKYINGDTHEDAISLVLGTCNLDALKALLSVSRDTIDHNYLLERTLTSAASPELKNEMLDFVLENCIGHTELSDYRLLHIACDHCNVHMAKWLLDHGANPNLYKGKVQHNENLLYKLFLTNLPMKLRDTFIEHENNKIDLNQRYGFEGNILFKVLGKYIETHDSSYATSMEYLINSGMDINAKNGYGQSLLEVACRGEFADAVEFLISHGADTNGIHPNVIHLSNDIAAVFIHHEITLNNAEDEDLHHHVIDGNTGAIGIALHILHTDE